MSKIFKYLSIVLVIIVLIVVIYNVFNKKPSETNDQNTINSQVKLYDALSKSSLYKYLFKDTNMKLMYEGGPSHWGSRTIEYLGDFKTDNSVGVNLKVTDNSDLKGEDPAKVWNEKWELKNEGMYIDQNLVIKYPIAIGQSWQVSNYSPVIYKDKKYTANIEILDVVKPADNKENGFGQIKTKLTINDIKTVSGGVYTEIVTYEENFGIIKKEVTEPTIKDFTLSYWLDRRSNI
jgi:hypothetical protein